jgi:uncharacterized protein
LPHNLASMVGVMDGAASDLRPGLPWQMVEIHEPLRILFVIESTPEVLLGIVTRNEEMRRLVFNGWVQLATLDPYSAQIEYFNAGNFEGHSPQTEALPRVASSIDWYRGRRDHVPYAWIERGEEAPCTN